MNKGPSPRLDNILIRVPNWLGDSMMATPAVALVRELLPRARLTLLGKRVYTDFWEAFPGVDRYLPLERGFRGFWDTVGRIKKERFDGALVLPSSFSSAFMTLAAGIPLRAGWGGEGREFLLTHAVPRPRPREQHLVWEYRDLVQGSLGAPKGYGGTARLQAPVTAMALRELKRVWADTGVRGKSFIALAPGATYGEAKRWPLSHWRGLIGGLLKERPESILVLGGMEEEDYLRPLLEGWPGPSIARRLHLLAGKTSPSILAAMLSRCKLLITNDTGPMHVAAAVGTPTVALFGSTSPVWTRPFGTGHEVIYHQVECSPCFQRTCPIGYICLKGISVEEVLKTALGKLRKPVKIGAERRP